MTLDGFSSVKEAAKVFFLDFKVRRHRESRDALCGLFQKPTGDDAAVNGRRTATARTRNGSLPANVDVAF